MAHRVLSLKYRPQNFDELTGQNHIVISLKGAINSGRVGHAFLFSGPRGVGKTSTARIFAKSLNCVQGPTVYPCQECQSCKEITMSRYIDVIEIDGASNRGIEEIRNLRESVKYTPLHGRKKIYIIDEVHMLTNEAFNALLKTLEEPPSNVVFIFATTNVMKVPATILSRCQRFTFKRLTVKEIASRLEEIAKKESVKISKTAIHYLAVRADGSVRDGESIMEQLVSFVEGEITEKDVFELVGFLGTDFYLDLLKKIINGDLAAVISMLNRAIEDGGDPIEIYRGFTNYMRAALLHRAKVSEEYLDLDDDELAQLKTLTLSDAEIINIIERCLGFEEIVRRSINSRIAVELLFSHLTLKSGKKNNENPGPRTERSVRTNEAADFKSKLFVALQEDSPRLAGLIHRAEIIEQGTKITFQVENEYALRQLENNRLQLSAKVQVLMPEGFNLDFVIAKDKEKEGSNFIETLRGLFDGEEIK
ncbi:DNA polymerase III, subunit gamma and tau [candidate division WOR-3 bacterium RBG_13_43_14]|uniref:DNA polymerase III subunit gamma/tau n=1 Tax=candidate division WOR-3 bacterium RBG_13_43_14 TaxID=1802590 RepID=A0A1F4UEG9_UNCW3|nr:MAG: DNA polymerase III, subunit gamma and tau [candidate division WOR-3 bacterium RBG_13_43_14]